MGRFSVLMLTVILCAGLFGLDAATAQFEFNCMSVFEIPLEECEALVSLFKSTGGADWYVRTDWMGTYTPCTWYGVSCLGGFVYRLTLPQNNLSGSLPMELSYLTHLVELNLSWNALVGSLPAQLGSLTNLSVLNLTVNQLTGNIPTTFGNLTDLQTLDLSSNLLTGSLPAELGSLANLSVLKLSSNQLAESMPAELGNLYSLQSLDLSSNDLTGGIPQQLSNLVNLSILNLSRNGLNEELPPELGDLPNLTILDLSHNPLTGSIPPELGKLSTLVYLYLYENQLTGSIPPELSSLTNLSVLMLGATQLTGSIPAELGNLANLQDLRLFSNQLSGSIPAELGNLTNLNTLVLSGNQLSGNIPAQLGNLTNLYTLDLSSNQLSGSIPVDLANLTNLQSLTLSYNQLSGSLPPELGNMHNLGILEIIANQLTGSIPPELGNLTNLTGLSLISNQLTGSIPPELGNMTNLASLDLHINSLTGSIPPELGNLSNLQNLYLENNGLTGSIPPELGNLSNLRSLLLRFNQLSGGIPPEFSQLTKLESLHIGYNPLTGSIPLSFTNLTQLQYFHFYGTGLCEPDDPVYQAWKATRYYYEGTDFIREIEPWLLMYYFAGDNDLSQKIPELTSAILSSSDNPGVNVAIYADDLDAPRYIGSNSVITITVALNELDSGDPQTLIDFIDWAKLSFPAEHTALTILDHGNALSGVGLDLTDGGDYLSPPELQQVFSTTQPVNVLHMYTPLMGNLEAAYQLRGSADYYLGSENIAWGLNIFADYLPLVTEQTISEELAIMMAESYSRAASQMELPYDISVLDMSKLDNLVIRTSALADAILAAWEKADQVWAVTEAGTLQRFDSNPPQFVINDDDVLADLFHFAQLVGEISGLETTAGEVMSAVDEAVIYNQFLSGEFTQDDEKYFYDLENSHGLSIGLPRSSISYYTAEWLDFAAGANWSILPSAKFDLEGERLYELSWGALISNLVKEFNPDAPDTPDPPPLLPLLEVYYAYNFLPLVRK